MIDTINEQPESIQAGTDGAGQVIQPNATASTSGTYAQLLGMTLQASLQEITEYTNLIKTAKTQAKKDLYQRKIKKIAKRIQRIVPSI